MVSWSFFFFFFCVQNLNYFPQPVAYLLLGNQLDLDFIQ